MRIDLFLAQNGMIKSRELAKAIIKSGGVSVNGRSVEKPSFEVTDNDEIKITAEMPRYVGRGGYKLEKAIECFGISLNGLVCIDIGASTGGFTDCMLRKGAAFVYAVDVGHDQLAPELRSDVRVRSMEGVNIKDADVHDFEKKIGFAAADVSFISLTKIIPAISGLLSEDGQAVFLIKPQFECGKHEVGKNGIVRSPKVHACVMKEVYSCCGINGFGIQGLDYSPICGGDGNIEYLMYAVKSADSKSFDFDKIAAEANKALKANNK